MAALFCDSFDHYVTADVTTKWNAISNGSIDPTNGRRGGGCYRGIVNGSWINIVPYPAPSGAVLIGGAAYLRTSTFNGAQNGTCFGDDTLCAWSQGGQIQGWIRINTNGSLSYLRTTPGASVVAGPTVQALQVNVYAYIEVKVLIHASAGTVDIRVNNASWLSVTGLNTQRTGSATWDQFHLGGPGYFDDLYLLDGSGSDNNAFLGDSRVDALRPNAAGASSQFTRSAGTDQSATIDDAAPNGDTDYNETATATNRDSLNFPNAPVAGAQIKFVQALASAKKTDAGGAGLKLSTRQSSTNYDGAEVSLSTAYFFARQVWGVNPATGVAWTDTIINNAEFGYVKST